ncbi:MAG: alpha/beta fold hydrolase [Chloroflexi bacterium]|nr:alpha/beta fold hydrolase [Chloroflexota bacterium]
MQLPSDVRGKGTPLLWIHGFPLSRRMWAEQMGALADRARMIALDLRGHGEAPATEGVYSMELLAEDCLDVLRGQGVQEPAVVCGLSMGGYVALAFYRRYPQQVRGLILAATRATADTPEGKKGREQGAAMARQAGAEWAFDTMLPKMLAAQRYESDPALVERVRGVMAGAKVDGIAGALLGMRDRPDSTPMLAAIGCPALIIHGEEDALIPLAAAQAMQAQIPGARLAVIPQAGHLPNMEQPEIFNRAVREFLDSID